MMNPKPFGASVDIKYLVKKMAKTKIEWCKRRGRKGYSWNPTRGCTQISPGCTNCYAKTISERFRGAEGNAYEFGFDLKLAPHKLAEPAHWLTSSMVFTNSMSDLFHEDIPTDYIVDVCRTMELVDWHVYQVLTKRSERLCELMNNELRHLRKVNHIWFGVSVENQKYGLPRIQHLREARCAMPWLSIEPLLEDLGRFSLVGIKHVVVGGESGHHARGMEPEWAIAIRDKCFTRRIPFFFKQHGGRQKWKTGRKLQGKEYNQFPKFKFNRPPNFFQRKRILEEIETMTRKWQGHPLAMPRLERLSVDRLT